MKHQIILTSKNIDPIVIHCYLEYGISIINNISVSLLSQSAYVLYIFLHTRIRYVCMIVGICYVLLQKMGLQRQKKLLDYYVYCLVQYSMISYFKNTTSSHFICRQFVIWFHTFKVDMTFEILIIMPLFRYCIEK